MITNTGKNIIAKYLIGDAPAYASYIAMGCGPKPRSKSSTMVNVNTQNLSGTIVGATATSTITGLTTTVGLIVGMGVEKVSGAGAFGGTSQIAKIVSIDSHTQITVTASGSNTAGAIVFNIVKDTSTTDPVSYSVLTCDSLDALWVGAKISIITSQVGTGTLDPNQDTIVTSINTYDDAEVKSFTVSPATINDIVDADILVEIDPAKKSLDFEMFRVPISSRGYVNDNGVNKIVLTAQLPTEERYEISEIGVYSAGSNTTAGQYDSKVITGFSDDESWKLSDGTTLTAPSSDAGSAFPIVQTSLINPSNQIITTTQAIKTSTANGLFSDVTRLARYERPRFLSNAILVKSDTSFIHYDKTAKESTVAPGPVFLQLSGKSVDFSKNSLSDLIKTTFSLVAITGNDTNLPEDLNVVVEFTNSVGSQYAKMSINVDSELNRVRDNRYVYAEKRLDELTYSSGDFSWKNVDTIKAYVSGTNKLLVTTRDATTTVATIETTSAHELAIGDYVYVSNVSTQAAPGFDGLHQVTDIPSSTEFSYERLGTALVTPQSVTNGYAHVANHNFYIALDALRIDNISSENPLYGMTGYSIVQNTSEKTVVKSPNTNNYIEYRFILDVT